MCSVEIGKKIDDYAKAHYKELKQNEQVLNKTMSKYDIAQIMLNNGTLKEKEFVSWMNTREGFEASKLTELQERRLLSGNVWDFTVNIKSSYLDSLSADVNDNVAFNNIYGLEINPKSFENNPMHKIMVERYNQFGTPDISYTAIMDVIKAKDLSNEEQLEFLLKRTGERFYEAKANGDKATMKETLLQGFGLVFAVMDENIGITDFKEFLKDVSGLNALVEKIDKFVEDGDDNDLSFTEKAWSATKGAGDVLDGMIGTKGLAFAGSLAAATEAATACGLGKIFSIGLQSAFAYNGASLTIEGSVDLYNATTAEQARDAGQDLAAGGLLLYGTYKSVKQGLANYKAQQNALENDLNSAKETLGLKDNYTLKDLKRAYRELCKTEHPDKGGTIDRFDKITDAYDLLLKHLDSTPILNPQKTAKTQSTSDLNSSNLPSVTQKVTDAKVDYVGSTAAFTGAETTPVSLESGIEGGFDGVTDATVMNTEIVLTEASTVVSNPVTQPIEGVVQVTEFKAITPQKNYFSGYCNSDGTLNVDKVTQYFTETRRALQTPENAVEKVIIDCCPRREIESLAKDYPLFTQYFINALENGFAVSPANKQAVEACSYSDPKLIKYAEEYLSKGLTFKDITSYREFEYKIRVNQKLSKTLKSFSLETQQKYLDFLYKTNTEAQYQKFSSGLNFVVENIPNEEFLMECLKNPQKFEEITMVEREVMQHFVERTTSKVYEINYQDLLKVADFPKIKSQLVLMKMYYPDNYAKLISSEGFRSVVWNFNPNKIRLLEDIQYDKPVTNTNLAGVDVTDVIKSKNVITEQMAKGNSAAKFNVSDKINNAFRTNIRVHAESKNLICEESTTGNSGTQFILKDKSGNVVKVYRTGKLNPKNIGEVQQIFYDRYGRREISVTYSAIDNKFTITNGSTTETLYSLKEYKSKYSRFQFDSDLQSYIWINDNGFQSRR